MKEAEVYQLIWRKYLPVITMRLKQVVRTGEPVTIGMYKFEFQSEGNKKKSGYHFNLEMKDGRVANDIGKNLPAKELSDMLRQDPNTRPILNEGYFTITLSPEFILTIDKKKV